MLQNAQYEWCSNVLNCVYVCENFLLGLFFLAHSEMSGKYDVGVDGVAVISLLSLSVTFSIIFKIAIEYP